MGRRWSRGAGVLAVGLVVVLGTMLIVLAVVIVMVVVAVVLLVTAGPVIKSGVSIGLHAIRHVHALQVHRRCR